MHAPARHIHRLGVLCLALYCPALAAAPAPSSSHTLLQAPPVVVLPDFTKLPRATVLHIIDGDSIRLGVNGRQIECRLAGVDAPEIAGPADHKAREALQFLQRLLEGEEVYVAVAAGSRQQDEHGRTLAFLFRAPDGLYVNLELVRQGYARVFNAVPYLHHEAFKAWETRAQTTGKGIWGDMPGRADQTAPPVKNSPPVQTLVSPSAGMPRTAPSSGVAANLYQVYITDSGTKYHAAGCSALRKSSTLATLEEARKKYEPCRLCNPPK